MAGPFRSRPCLRLFVPSAVRGPPDLPAVCGRLPPPSCWQPPGAQAADNTKDQARDQARALFDRDWQWRLQTQPEYATSAGDHRYDAALSDTSLAARRKALAHERRMLEPARQLDRNRLAGQDLLSSDLFVDRQGARLARTASPRRPAADHGADGIHVRLPQLAAQMPFVTEDDYRAYIARLTRAAPHRRHRRTDARRHAHRLDRAQSRWWPALPAQLSELREHLGDGALGPLPAPARDHPASRTRKTGARTAPPPSRRRRASLQQLEDFVRNEYLPAARTRIARLQPARRRRLVRLSWSKAPPPPTCCRPDPRAGPEGSGAHPRPRCAALVAAHRLSRHPGAIYRLRAQRPAPVLHAPGRC